MIAELLCHVSRRPVAVIGGVVVRLLLLAVLPGTHEYCET
jgi:hypothetical protein